MNKKIRRFIPYLLILILIIGSIIIYRKDKGAEILIEEEASIEDIDLEEDEDPKDSEEATIVVHIAGAVEKPGVLSLESGSRLVDAVDLSQGAKEDADLDQVNLARILEDEEKIYIPYIGEEMYDLELPESEISDKIDINKCSKEELTSLSGIGDKTAEKILDYREKQKFEKIEDLKNVSGIGDKKFEAIENDIIVK